jgi:hypothetical protein
MPDPKPDDVDFHEETDSPTYADDRNLYKVEKWTRDGTKVDRLLYAGNSLGRARSVFESAGQAPATDQIDGPTENTSDRSAIVLCPARSTLSKVISRVW